jgi:hypothetical protein
LVIFNNNFNGHMINWNLTVALELQEVLLALQEVIASFAGWSYCLAVFIIQAKRRTKTHKWTPTTFLSR